MKIEINNMLTNLIEKNIHKIFYFFSIIIIFTTFFFGFQNFTNISGYWFDEWCTLLNADPNSNLEIIKNRFWGNIDKPQEEVPIFYYLTLRIFFTLFGYTSENGRIFSLIFYFLSFVSIYYFSRFTFNKSQSILLASFYFSTPFILWMSNETRVDMFLVFFSLINLIIFFKAYTLSNKKNKFLLCLVNIVTLSVYPLTFSLLISQVLFSFIKKKYDLVLIIIISFFIYALVNYEYILVKSITKGHHYASLESSFFIGYFFNKFFGSVFFGLIYLISCFYFLIKNFRKIISNDFVFLILLSILLTYLMVITSSLILIPMAAPRYIIFVVPLILIFLFSNIFLFEKRKILLIFVFFIISIINLSTNYNNMPIKKPKTNEALLIIKNLKESNLYIQPEQKLFINYISTLKLINSFEIISKKEIDNYNIESFALLCLNNPNYAYSIKPITKNKKCTKEYNGYKDMKEIIFNDFIIRIINKT